MTAIAFAVEATGSQYAAPTFKVYVARVLPAPQSDLPGQADWLTETFAEDWTPVELTWAANGRASTLRLRRVLGVGPARADRERADEAALSPGVRVRLVEVQTAGPAGCVEREWFRGYVIKSRLLVDASDDGEVCEVVAHGPEALLRGKALSGQWHARPAVADALVAGSANSADFARASTFRSHLPVTFNADGLPNAAPVSAGAWRLDSQGLAALAGSRVFDTPDRRVPEAGYQAELWDPASAIRSIVELIDGYTVISPASLASLPAELAGMVLGEVAVEGLSVLDAIAAVLTRVGYGYCIEPWADSHGRHALRVFERSGAVAGARVRRPFMAPIDGEAVRADDAVGRRAEVLRIELVRDSRYVRNEVTVIGSPVRRQVSLVFSDAAGQLQPAWDTDEHDLSDWASDGVVDPLKWTESGSYTAEQFDKLYTYGAASAVSSRHAFRSFAWNEDGSLLGATRAAGDLSDMGVTASGDYLRRPRPVGPTLIRDDPAAKVRNLPPQVLLGIAGDDDSWIQVPAVIWTDRAGFTLPVNPLWRWHPYCCERARNVTSGSETLFEKYGGYSYLTLLNNALTSQSPALSLNLVGSIECDQAVTVTVPRRAESSWPIAAERIVHAGRRFLRYDVPAGSDPFGLSDDRHDTRDETSSAAVHAAQLRAAGESEIHHGSITLRQLTRACAPGDVIPGTRGRRIDLTLSGSGGTRAPIVTGVRWDFSPGAAHTEIVLGST